MESDPSEPSYPSVIRFTSDSSSFAAGQAPCPGVDEGSFAPESYAMGMGEPVEEAVEIIHSEVSGMDLFYFEDDLGLHMLSLDGKITPSCCSPRVIIYGTFGW